MVNASIPPNDNMFMIGIWIQTALYEFIGVNTMVFAAAIFVLTKMYRARTSSAGLLIGTSIVLFSLSTAYVSVCLRQLLEAFIWGTPGGASTYFANIQDHLAITKLALYEFNIWRMWVVYGNRWIIVALPIVVELAHIVAGIFTIHRGAFPGVSVFDPLVHRGAIAYWTLDLTVNIGVTLCIAYRLWSAGHTLETVGMKRTKHPFIGAILILVESGGIFATATLITVSLYLSGNSASVAAIDSVVQLAVISPDFSYVGCDLRLFLQTITPLLIVVQVGFGLQHVSSDTIIAFRTNTSHSHSISNPPNQLLQVDISETSNTADVTFAHELDIVSLAYSQT
ncbi:hypothetical protein F5051DRAFT_446765 [Lentinula edodes]|nr:hypothetical protein F5051DRAFT_446765 [Lentinula edodes]